jgi:hypothetical protein
MVLRGAGHGEDKHPGDAPRMQAPRCDRLGRKAHPVHPRSLVRVTLAAVQRCPGGRGALLHVGVREGKCYAVSSFLKGSARHRQ